ncbi:MAG TPA: glycosyltransferase [Thermoanaerobaculia bacterium]|nr:glycosyltransferase [Thermoanaerobaculia bacterium]
MTELSILLPVRDETLNLKLMLKILNAVLEIPHEVLVVHDSPNDLSIPVVDEIAARFPNVRRIHNTVGRGVINALRAGVAEAQGRYVLIFAADEVGPVLAIEDMLVLMNQGCDLVSCTRYAHGGRRLGGSWIGGVLSLLANRLLHRLAYCALSDATTGIKMFRRSLFEELHLEARPIGWAVTFEMAIKAQLKGARLGEVPIVSIDRLYGGQSTFRIGPWVGEYLRWFLWGAMRLRAAVRQNGKPEVSVRIPMTTLIR